MSRAVGPGTPRRRRRPGVTDVQTGTATVLVGVDGTGRSRATIQAAAREARRRDATLIAVMAYSGGRLLGAPAARPGATLRTAGDERLAAETALRDTVADALGGEAD